MNALMTNYGFTESFKNEAENLKYDIKNFEHLSPARILSQEKGFYRIICEKGEKLLFKKGCRYYTTGTGCRRQY